MIEISDSSLFKHHSKHLTPRVTIVNAACHCHLHIICHKQSGPQGAFHWTLFRGFTGFRVLGCLGCDFYHTAQLFDYSRRL